MYTLHYDLALWTVIPRDLQGIGVAAFVFGKWSDVVAFLGILAGDVTVRLASPGESV